MSPVRIALIVLLIGGAVISCAPVTQPGSGDTAVTNQETLMERARQLAEQELARLSAAEMIYRNKVYDHVYVDEDNGVRTDILMKYYRNFRGAEVLDLKRTDSLLYPLEFVIRYDFDMLGTRTEAGLPTTMAETAKKVKNDNSFRVYASDSLVRQYRCDASGEHDQSIAELLPRPNYWELNPWAKAYGVLQVEDLTALAGP